MSRSHAIASTYREHYNLEEASAYIIDAVANLYHEHRRRNGGYQCLHARALLHVIELAAAGDYLGLDPGLGEVTVIRRFIQSPLWRLLSVSQRLLWAKWMKAQLDEVAFSHSQSRFPWEAGFVNYEKETRDAWSALYRALRLPWYWRVDGIPYPRDPPRTSKRPRDSPSPPSSPPPPASPPLIEPQPRACCCSVPIAWCPCIAVSFSLDRVMDFCGCLVSCVHGAWSRSVWGAVSPDALELHAVAHSDAVVPAGSQSLIRVTLRFRDKTWSCYRLTILVLAHSVFSSVPRSLVREMGMLASRCSTLRAFLLLFQLCNPWRGSC